MGNSALVGLIRVGFFFDIAAVPHDTAEAQLERVKAMNEGLAVIER